jgi:hypothetical protein
LLDPIGIYYWKSSRNCLCFIERDAPLFDQVFSRTTDLDSRAFA